MRITIDSAALLLPSAGVKNYLYYWLLALRTAASERGDTVKTYPPGTPIPSTLDHQQAASSWLKTSRLNLMRFLNVRWNPALDLAVRGADVFHCSQHMARRPNLRVATATVFDFSCWIVPETHTPANIAATRLYAERILKKSAGLIAISENTRRDAVEILGIPEDRIRVIYPGVADAFFEEAPPERVADIEARYGLHIPYLLFVGCIEPRKNVTNIIRSYELLPESLRRDCELVLAGPLGWESEAVLSTLTAPKSNIRYLGYVPESDLPVLVQKAAGLLYPSFYEGFGLPAAQAMAAGTPVIVSNRSSLPEIVGDGGLLVNPHSIHELRDAMQQLLTCVGLAKELAKRGKSRAENFRWSICAARSLDFFHDVAERQQG